MMRKILILGMALVGLTGATDKPDYTVTSIKTVDDCHALYDTLAPGWRLRRSFIITKSKAGEHVTNCMATSVAEYSCDISSERLTAAVLQGGSLKECKPYFPHAPFVLKGALLPN